MDKDFIYVLLVEDRSSNVSEYRKLLIELGFNKDRILVATSKHHAMEDVKTKHPFPLLVLIDIHLGDGREEDGRLLGKEIELYANKHNCVVDGLYMTAHKRQYASQTLGNLFQYVHKDSAFESSDALNNYLERALYQICIFRGRYFSIKNVSDKYETIHHSQILWITPQKKEDSVTKIYGSSTIAEIYVTHKNAPILYNGHEGSLKNFKEGGDFYHPSLVEVHRSYIVNKYHAKRKGANEITITGLDKPITVSREFDWDKLLP